VAFCPYFTFLNKISTGDYIYIVDCGIVAMYDGEHYEPATKFPQPTKFPSLPFRTCCCHKFSVRQLWRLLQFAWLCAVLCESGDNASVCKKPLPCQLASLYWVCRDAMHWLFFRLSVMSAQWVAAQEAWLHSHCDNKYRHKCTNEASNREFWSLKSTCILACLPEFASRCLLRCLLNKRNDFL